MRVLLLAQGVDTGGVSARLAAAFRRWRPGWVVEHVAGRTAFFHYPGQRLWRDAPVQDLYDAADVVQFQNSVGSYAALDHDQRKPVVVAQQGTYLRDYPAVVCSIADAIGADMSVSTIDLLADAPRAWWAPHLFDLPAVAAIRQREYQPGRRRLRIAHAPTNRAVKSTRYVLAVLERLAARYPIEVDLIERAPWAECMARKARADLVVDQLVLGYGLNAIEAWAMGVPVVGGWADPADVARGLALWGQLPYRDNATAGNLEAVLDAYLASPTVRAEAGAQGLAHVERWHSEPTVVDYMADRWASVPPSAGGSALRSWRRPAVQRLDNLPSDPELPRPRATPPRGVLPRPITRRGRAGYRRPVPTYDPAYPGLVLV